MASGAELRGRVTLDSTKFHAGLRRLRRSARQFARGAGRDIADVTRAMSRLAVVTTVASAAAFAVATRAATKYGDEIDKAAARTGATTEEIAALRHQADLAGADFSQMEKAFQGQARAVNDLRLGLSTSKDAFGQLGLAMEGLEGKSPVGTFVLIAQRLDAIEDPQKKAAIAMRLFGRAGRQVIPMLAGVAKGLDNAKNQADRLGLLVTPEQAQGAAAVQDEITRLQGAVLGLARNAVDLDRVARGIRVITNAAVELRNSRAFRETAARMNDMAEGIAKGVLRAVRAFNDLSASTRQAFANMGAVGAGFVLLWATGVVQPILRLTGRLVGAVISMLNPAVLLAGLVGLPAFLAGLALGDALDETFDLSGIVAKLAIRAQAIVDTYALLPEAIYRALAGDTKTAGIILRQGTAIRKKMLADIKAIDKVGDDGGGNFAENYVLAVGEIVETVEDAKGKIGKALGGVLEDRILGPLDEARKAWDKFANIQLPDIGDPVQDAAGAAGEFADEMERAERSMARVRNRGIASALPGAGIVQRAVERLRVNIPVKTTNFAEQARALAMLPGDQFEEEMLRLTGVRRIDPGADVAAMPANRPAPVGGGIPMPQNKRKPQAAMGGVAESLRTLITLARQRNAVLEEISTRRLEAFV